MSGMFFETQYRLAFNCRTLVYKYGVDNCDLFFYLLYL